MAEPTPTPPAPRSSGVVPAEWPAQAADAIVEVVGKVRDKTTKPAVTAARGLVYGILAGIVGLVAFVVLIALLVRLFANYVGNEWVFTLYLGLGVLFAAGGLFLLGKAKHPASADDD